jgi:hypothetical protein
VTVSGTPQTITLSGKGEQPLVKIVLSVTSPASGPVQGQPATVTATVTQPNIAGVTPGGTVNFTYRIDCDGTTGSLSAPLSGSGGTSTATLTLPTLLQGRRYTINATFVMDNQDSTTVATPLVINIPGIQVTATASSGTFVYGTSPGTITGTVTPNPAPVTFSFTTAATATTPIGTYPITVVFACTAAGAPYGFPPVLTPGGAPAVEVETAAPLAVKANNFTSLYGAADLNYTAVVTGAVNGDQFA